MPPAVWLQDRRQEQEDHHQRSADPEHRGSRRRGKRETEITGQTGRTRKAQAATAEEQSSSATRHSVGAALSSSFCPNLSVHLSSIGRRTGKPQISTALRVLPCSLSPGRFIGCILDDRIDDERGREGEGRRAYSCIPWPLVVGDDDSERRCLYRFPSSFLLPLSLPFARCPAASPSLCL